MVHEAGCAGVERWPARLLLLPEAFSIQKNLCFGLVAYGSYIFFHSASSTASAAENDTNGTTQHRKGDRLKGINGRSLSHLIPMMATLVCHGVQ